VKTLWKCYNCLAPAGTLGLDFAADEGGPVVCPGCTLARDTPEGAVLIVAREVIHFTASHAVLKTRGCGVRLCDRRAYAADPGQLYAVTAHRDAVTCPGCLDRLADRDRAAGHNPPPA